MSVLLSSKNIFLSTQPSGNLSNVDDGINKFRACLNNIPLQSGLNQYGKISLIDFHMYRNFYKVNQTNNTFFMEVTPASGDKIYKTCTIPPGDYRLGEELSTAVANEVKRAFATIDGQSLSSVGTILPTTDRRVNQNGTGILDFVLTPQNNSAISDIKFQCRNYNSGKNTGADGDYNDSYALLGAKRVTQADASLPAFTTESLSVAPGKVANTWQIKGYYQMQDATIPYVFLRCSEVLENLESENYRLGEGTTTDTHIIQSTTLAKIKVGLEEVEFLGDTSTPYSIMTDNRNISQLFFQCVDQHGRSLPAIDKDQTTLGNLFLDMTINYSVYSRGVGQPENTNIENNGLNNAMFQTGIR